MSGKVWSRGMAILLPVNAIALIAALIVGPEGWWNPQIMTIVRISSALLFLWFLAGFGSFVAKYHPRFNHEQKETDNE